MDFLQSFYDKHEKIWTGSKKHSYYDFDTSLGKIIFSTMKNYPKNIIQISDSDGKTLTNNEALPWAIRLAQTFKKLGLKHEDVIGISARNTTYVLPVVVGSLMNCTPFHAVNPTLDGKSLEHLFGLTKPKVIFCDGSEYEKIRRATKVFKPLIYTLTQHIEDVPKVEDLLEPTRTELFYAPEALVRGGDQTIAILCSSGTTGMPKAVCISNHILVFENSATMTCEDIVFGYSCVDWMSGLVMLTMCCSQGITRIITDQPYTPEHFVEMVNKYKATFTIMSPNQVFRLNNCPAATTTSLATLRFVMLGGGAISMSALQRLQDTLPTAYICNSYGFTEGAGVSAGFGLSAGSSVGKLLPGVRVRIVDDNGKNLGPNEVGEIYVHGLPWNGYYGNPKESQRMQDSLGWYHSGDLGYFDEKSFLFITDRKKDIMKYQSNHYWPAEIEDVIAELPEVVAVCVVGIYDECNGDSAGAVVVKAKNSTLTDQAIMDHVAKRLIDSFKHLHAGVRFVEHLPANDNGKVVKNQAKLLFATT